MDFEFFLPERPAPRVPFRTVAATARRRVHWLLVCVAVVACKGQLVGPPVPEVNVGGGRGNIILGGRPGSTVGSSLTGGNDARGGNGELAQGGQGAAGIADMVHQGGVDTMPLGVGGGGATGTETATLGTGGGDPVPLGIGGGGAVPLGGGGGAVPLGGGGGATGTETATLGTGGAPVAAGGAPASSNCALDNFTLDRCTL